MVISSLLYARGVAAYLRDQFIHISRANGLKSGA